jgi:L-aminopeptidase/D-esterase-like protein
MSMQLAILPRVARRAPARLAVQAFGAALAVLTAAAAASGQRPGPSNTITDVPGIKVGHETRIGGGYRTGTTVILTERGATAGFSQQGGAPGTKEVALLEPGGLVTQVNAIVLSGGSAYGLDAATGVMRWLEEHGFGFPVPGGVVPIVPAAILFDLGRGGDFKARPDAEFGYRAAAAATADPVPMGRVGAGTGARHGLGSASVVLDNGYTVGAIVALNPAGSVVNPQTCLPYGVFLELDGEFGLIQPRAEECHPAGSDGSENGGEWDGRSFNTTIAVVATDAPLDQTQAKRMAMIANSGLARAIKPVHGLGDGDLVFAVATTPPDRTLSLRDLDAIYNAGADVLGRAVVHALLNAGTIGNSPSYCDRYPSACRNRKSTP